MALGSDRPVFVISVAAELAGMHPQTLRQYDRMGLVQPSRAPGRARRYSQRDVEKLQEIQDLSQSGVSLEGIKRIMSLQNQLDDMTARVADLMDQLDAAHAKLAESSRVFAAGTSGDVVGLTRGKRPEPRQRSQAVVLYRGNRNR
ncbi:heat shock protein transcriptional repressor HspR [Rothia aerolata]|uniref:Transcriptional regulator n=1 Tax=Rothia aerolata TaxID=1812262 RepID=A0A917MTC3_9MICC|nr:helix-turn-helix transcriptional regulator [Rothia aerolata]GGH62465.1 transcriptional regulator [Rothia aerolata]